eukprot:Amastigsp_a1203_22.p4 type:complete len:140 gc:universal Amastigsp_a1203_22:641-1060(+)
MRMPCAPMSLRARPSNPAPSPPRSSPTRTKASVPPSNSTWMSSPTRWISARCRRCAPCSRPRAAQSLQATRRRSTTAPQPWCWSPQATPRRTGSSRLPLSGATATPSLPRSSLPTPPRPPSLSPSAAPISPSRTSTFSR